jgi:hypothetical protein
MIDSLQQAIAYIEIDQPRRALPLLQSHLATFPDDSTALARLAEVQIALNEYDAARDAAERSLVLAPDNEHPLRILAIAHAHLGHHYLAVQIAEQARAIAPHHWQVHHVRVSVDVTVKKATQGGRNAVNSLLQLAPDSASAHLIAASHMLLKTFPTAEERAFARACITTALELDPQSSRAQYLLGILEMNTFGRSGKSLRPTFDSILSDPLDSGNRRYIVAAVIAGVRWLAVVYGVLIIGAFITWAVRDHLNYPVVSSVIGGTALVCTVFFVVMTRRDMGKRLWAFVRIIPRGGGLLMLRLFVMACSLVVLLLTPFLPFSILGWVGFFMPPLLYFTDVAAALDTKRKVSWREQWREWTRQSVD